jgi:hypothetical protein
VVTLNLFLCKVIPTLHQLYIFSCRDEYLYGLPGLYGKTFSTQSLNLMSYRVSFVNDSAVG